MPLANHANVFYQMMQTALNKANPSGLPSNLVLQSFAMPTDTITVQTVVEAIQTQLGYSYGWRERVASYRDLILGDKPVGYWPLSEVSGTTAYDQSGNGNNGSMAGVFTYQTPSGIFSGESSLGFNGSNTQINLPNGMLGSAAYDNLTTEAWCYDNGIGTGTMAGVISGTGNGWFDIELNDATIRWEARNASTGNSATTSATFLHQWHHIVMTLDAGLPKAYLDGQLVWTSSVNIGSIGPLNWSGSSTTDTPGIGVWDGWFVGYIQQCAIYNYALTAAQVQNHYNAGKGLFSITEPYGAAWLLKLHAQIPSGASVSLAAAVGTGGTTPIPLVDPASTLVAGDTFRWQPATALGVVGIGPWGTPSAWPDPAATWLGPTADATANVPVGQWLLKKWVFSPTPQTVTVSVAADNLGTLFVGGQQVVQTTSFSTTTQATVLLEAGWNHVSVSCLNTGSTPNPTGVLLSIQDSQGTVLENGSTDARVGCTWETTGFINPAWTTVTSAEDLLYHWAVIPASALTSEDVTLTVTPTASSSGAGPLIHGVDWITIAPWRWDQGALYDQAASPTPPAQVAPRVVLQTVD